MVNNISGMEWVPCLWGHRLCWEVQRYLDLGMRQLKSFWSYKPSFRFFLCNVSQTSSYEWDLFASPLFRAVNVHFSLVHFTCFDPRANSVTSSVTEQIKLLSQGTSVRSCLIPHGIPPLSVHSQIFVCFIIMHTVTQPLKCI